MSRKPSIETQLRQAKADLKNRERRIMELMRSEQIALTDVRDAQSAARHAQQRATRAEDEAAEWKARFDALLSRVPKTEPLS